MLQEELKDLKELEMEKRLYLPARHVETWPQAGLKSILHSAGIRKIHMHVHKVSLVEIGQEQVETGRGQGKDGRTAVEKILTLSCHAETVQKQEKEGNDDDMRP